MEKMMKVLRLLSASLMLSAVLVAQAHARDSFNVGINVGTFAYAPPVVTHYPHTIYYSNTPTVVYYDTAPIVHYVPVIRYQSYPQHHSRGYQRDYYQQWNNRWQGNHHDNHHGNGHGHRGGRD
jgi:hypothetical protein